MADKYDIPELRSYALQRFDSGVTWCVPLEQLPEIVDLVCTIIPPSCEDVRVVITNYCTQRLEETYQDDNVLIPWVNMEIWRHYLCKKCIRVWTRMQSSRDGHLKMNKKRLSRRGRSLMN